MTKKDFEQIATILQNADVGKPTRHYLAVEFATALWNTNPAFDRGRFIAAATRGNMGSNCPKCGAAEHVTTCKGL